MLLDPLCFRGIPLKMWSECVLTATYLINRLPSSVLNGKSPYELIYNEKHVLDHLRVFGCLCFATILNDSDKMSSRYEKCVMIGYSNVKKGYKLYSLDKHQFIFSRDVQFYEIVFPFKGSNTDNADATSENVVQDLNQLNFFDMEHPEIPYDDESCLNCDYKSQSEGSSCNTPKIIAAEDCVTGYYFIVHSTSYRKRL